MSHQAFTKSLVFIDAAVGDYQSLVNGVVAGTEVIVLDLQRDGVVQITEALRDRPTPVSIHIVSHGAPGTLYLGNSQLSLRTLARYAADLQSWAAPQLLLYGCTVAAGDAGSEFIEKLHALTGANIAASTTVTGHAALGGNWDLDVTTDNAPVALAFNETVEAWQGILPATINPSGGNLANGSDGLRIILTNDGSYQIFYQGAKQVFGTNASTTAIGIGGATVGSAYPGNFNRTWDTLSQSVVEGAGSQADPFAVTTSLFDDIDNDNIYDVGVETKLNYSVAYVSGNPYFSQTFQITLPENNAQTIKLFQGMDTFLAGGDAGPAYGLNSAGTVISGTSDTPVLIGTVKNLGQPTESFLAYVQSGRAWDSWYSGFYYTQFEQVTNGGNLIKTYNTNASTDNGIGVQYNLGVATGVVTIRNKLTFDASTAADLATNVAPTTTGTTQTVTYTPNGGAVDFAAMTVTDPDAGDVITASFTLSIVSAGSLASSAGGTYNAGTGIWSVSGTTTQVNAALDLLQFTPASGFSQTASIEARISDGTDIIDTIIPLEATSVAPTNAPTGLVLPSDVMNDTGVSQSDRITSNFRPQFTGTAEASSTIRLYANGSEIAGNFTIDASGNWTFTPSVNLPNGASDITARATNAGGIQSVDSSAITVTTDATGPLAPGIAPDLEALSDTGASSIDNVTSDNTPTFVGVAGSGTAGDIVTLYEGSTELGTGIIAANGSWSVTASGLSNGVHSVSATFQDLAGNESAKSSALDVTIDAVVPNAPTSAPDLDAASDTGVSSVDDLTNDTTPTFVGAPGSGTPGSGVILYDGTSAIGTGIVAADGSWTATASVLSNGLHNISASFINVATGNESAKSSALPVTISNTAPTAPASAPDLVPASDTGASNTDNVTTDTTPTFVGAPGSGTPGQVVTLYEGISVVTPIGTGIIAADGSWSITASALGGGVNTIASTLTDAAGNESDLSPNLSITIEGVAPAAPTTSQLDPVTDSGVSSSDNLTNDKTPTFKGTNQPGNTVELFAGAVSLGRATVDSAGKWSLTPTSLLVDGTYQITLKAISPSGLVSASSAAVPLTIDTRPATAVILEIDQPVRDSGANTLTLRFSETVRNVDPSDLALSLNGQAVPLVGATLTTTDNLTWTLGNIPGLTLAAGDYQISLKPGNDIADSAGNALTTGNSTSWLTGYTSDAMPVFGFKDGKKGVKIRDGRDSDVLQGKGGRDVLSGGGGNDRLLGRGGSDKLKGGAGKDRMGGGTNNDQLFGGGGADRLKGRKGQDRLVGGAANDRLLGGGADDVLIGGQGKDILTGGNGKDSYTFDNLSEAGDRVTDFNSANDLLDVRGIFSASQFGGNNRFAQYHQFMQLVQVGSDTEVRVDTDGKGAGAAFTTVATLQNVLISSVKSTNFVVG